MGPIISFLKEIFYSNIIWAFIKTDENREIGFIKRMLEIWIINEIHHHNTYLFLQTKVCGNPFLFNFY